MDAKTRNLFLLGALAALCAGFAWGSGRSVFGAVFFALAFVAILGIAERHFRP